nr:hypothetical protein [Tanacetum cinerariifolium]
MRIEEYINVKFDESPPPKSPPLVDDDILENDIIQIQDKDLEIKENKPLNKEITNIKNSKDHPIETIIGSLNERTLRSQVQNQSNFFCFISFVEPKNIKEAIQDQSWTMAMQEELNQFKTNDVWSLVPPPRNQTIIGFVDNTLCTKKRSSHIIIFQIYMDDIIFGTTYQELCDDFLKIMHDESEMSMIGELNFFLGQQIKQLEDGIFFNQSKYIKEMLKKFSLEDSKPIKTPMSSETKFTSDEDGEPIDDTKYRGMIGSLLYLTASCPDIMFNICLYARFQEAPKTSYLEAIKRIFRYIKGTSHLGLWYPKGTGLETIVYTDSDHAGEYVDHKSTIGVCTFIAFLDSLGELPPFTTNPLPPRPSFDTIEHMAYEPPPIPPIESTFPSHTSVMEPPLPPQLSPNLPSINPPLPPLGPNNPFPMLTHEMFCEYF